MVHSVHYNIDSWKKAETVMLSLSDVVYTSLYKDFFNSSVGSHIRHLLDHYHVFLEGLETARIDYDRRPRNQRLETDLDEAVSAVRSLMIRLESRLPDIHESYPLEVRMDAGGFENEAAFHATTVGRELCFLLGHDIHHFAIIAAMLQQRGLPLPPDFGIAPSTLRYQQSQLKK